MLFFPPDIIRFGKNNGHTISDIYLYEVEYLEWLIEYIDEFEINVNDFYKLGKPKKFQKIINLKTESVKEIQSLLRIYKSVKNIKSSDSLIEFDYTFPNKVLDILSRKEIGIYEAPKWFRRPKPISISFELIRNILNNN